MDTCEGDSGGPIGVKLFNVGGALIPLVNGVVSFGTPCTAGLIGCILKQDSTLSAVISDVYISPVYRAGRPESDLALLMIAQCANHQIYRPVCLWDL